MRKNYLFIVFACMSIVVLQAQDATQIPTGILRWAEKKSEEVKKMVTVRPSQDANIIKLCVDYALLVDSARNKVSDRETIFLLEEEANKDFLYGLIRILDEVQLQEYLTSSVSAYTKKITHEALQKLSKRFPSMVFSQYEPALYDHILKERIVYARYKFETDVRDEHLDNLKKEEPRILALARASYVTSSGKKVSEIDAIVSLNKEQKNQMRDYAIVYYQKIDSIRYLSVNTETNADAQYSVVKEFFDSLMNILNEKQQYIYLESLVKHEAKAKAESKVSYLRESGKYSESELSAFSDVIYGHVLNEKITSARYKYDPTKRQQSLEKLKKEVPPILLRADALEKISLKGTTYSGVYQW